MSDSTSPLLEVLRLYATDITDSVLQLLGWSARITCMRGRLLEWPGNFEICQGFDLLIDACQPPRRAYKHGKFFAQIERSILLQYDVIQVHCCC